MRSLIIKTLSPQIKGLLIRVPQRFNLAADIPVQPSRFCGTAPPPLLCQPASFQHSLKTALARDLSMPPKIQLPDLARSPTQMPQLQTHDLANNFFSQLIGMSVRSARLLLQTLKTIAQKPLFPLVTRLGADPIFLAERSKIERPQRFDRKLHSLFHR